MGMCGVRSDQKSESCSRIEQKVRLVRVERSVENEVGDEERREKGERGEEDVHPK